jgi:hypothetical protein
MLQVVTNIGSDVTVDVLLPHCVLGMDFCAYCGSVRSERVWRSAGNREEELTEVEEASLGVGGGVELVHGNCFYV